MGGIFSIPIEYLMVGSALLILLSILASKLSDRFGVPALLLFLALGMLAGSDGPGGIYFDDPLVAQSLGVTALALILFSGGLDTEWQMIRPVLGRGIALATLGVLLTAFGVGLFASRLLGLTLLEGLLLGAVMSSTDAAAVFGVLRSRNVHLRGDLKPLLELESGSNDPMAVFLTTGLLGLLTTPGGAFTGLLLRFVVQMILGAWLGLVLGYAMSLLVNRLNLGYDGLYPVLTLAMVPLIYGATTLVGGNGFLAVYVAGIVVRNRPLLHKRNLLHFHDGLAWLMQIVMFLTLGLLVFPSQLVPVIGPGLLVTAFLMLVARPVGVWVTLLPFRMPWREKLLVAWVGLRGAVPIILGTYVLLAGIGEARLIFNLVFFVVLASTLLQGSSIPQVARWLGVDVPPEEEGGVECRQDSPLCRQLHEVIVSPNAEASGRALYSLELPPDLRVLLIGRCGRMIVPEGGEILQVGDRLLILSEAGLFRQVQPRLGNEVDAEGDLE